jgi:hypothetical protein
VPWSRVVALVGILGALLSGCSVLARDEAPPAAGGPCSGVTLSQVRGEQPSYVDRELDRFPADRTVCRGLWLPGANQWFVPQGVALQDRTAWVSGYRWREGYGKRYCRVMRVDLRDGRVLADERRVAWERPDGSTALCRHGGGLALTRHGLWIATSQRLWLLDPSRIGRDDPVVRTWQVAKPVSGGLLDTLPSTTPPDSGSVATGSAESDNIAPGSEDTTLVEPEPAAATAGLNLTVGSPSVVPDLSLPAAYRDPASVPPVVAAVNPGAGAKVQPSSPPEVRLAAPASIGKGLRNDDISGFYLALGGLAALLTVAAFVLRSGGRAAKAAAAGSMLKLPS